MVGSRSRRWKCLKIAGNGGGRGGRGSKKKRKKNSGKVAANQKKDGETNVYVGAKQTWTGGEGNGTDSREKQGARNERPQLVLFPPPTAPVFGGLHPYHAHWPVLSYSHAAWLRRKPNLGCCMRRFQPTGQTCRTGRRLLPSGEREAGAAPHLLRAARRVGHTGTLHRA